MARASRGVACQRLLPQVPRQLVALHLHAPRGIVEDKREVRSLVLQILHPHGAAGARERDVYLPAGASWLDAWTGRPVGETGWVTAAAPLERIPVYLRFSDYLISRDVVVARARDIDDFWRSWGAGTVRDDILRRYGVDWIVASRSETPAVLGGLPPTLLGNLEIRQEFTNREFIIFRVRAV